MYCFKTSLASVILTFGLSAGLAILVGEVNGQNQSTNSFGLDKYINNEDEVQKILDYCYQHADRPNPVQDLVGKGLVSANFTSDTCASVKQGYDKLIKLRQQAEEYYRKQFEP